MRVRVSRASCVCDTRQMCVWHAPNVCVTRACASHGSGYSADALCLVQHNILQWCVLVAWKHTRCRERLLTHRLEDDLLYCHVVVWASNCKWWCHMVHTNFETCAHIHWQMPTRTHKNTRFSVLYLHSRAHAHTHAHKVSLVHHCFITTYTHSR